MGAVYRPPHYNYNVFVDTLDNTLSMIAPQVENIILLGDFNMDFSVNDSLPTIVLSDCMLSFGLSQIIETPTRVTPFSLIIIDLIFVSDKSLISDSGVQNVHLADHEMIFCNLIFPKIISEPYWRTYRSLKYFDYKTFEFDLFQIPFYFLYDMNDVNLMADFLNDQLSRLMDFHIPLITSRFVKSPAPWLTQTIRDMQRLRNKAFKAFKKSNSLAHWNYYKSLRNITNKAIIREKRAYLEHQSKNPASNSRNMWRFLRNCGIINKRISRIPRHLHDPDAINDFFRNSIPFLQPDNVLLNSYLKDRLNDNNFEFHMVEENTVS